MVQGALFVPYRRDHQLVLDAMRAHPDVKAVFAHIDVVSGRTLWGHHAQLKFAFEWAKTDRSIVNELTSRR